MIEVKGRDGDLKKLDANKEIENSPSANKKFAVNGALHYARIVLSEDFQEAIAIGINGFNNSTGEIETEFEAYYVSKDNVLYPKIISEVKNFSFFKKENLEHLIEILDRLELTSEELEKIKKNAEDELERNIQHIHQSIYDNDIIKPLLATDQKLYLFCGLIMAAMRIDGVSDLTPQDLKGGLLESSNDGKILLDRILLFLEQKKTSQEKEDIVMNLITNIFETEALYRPRNGESLLKTLFKEVIERVIPSFNSKLHLDFTGKIFNKLSEWATISTDMKNDVVLTPRYITNLMARLARTDKDSYVLDSAMGSAGFLVSAMELMIRDAKEKLIVPSELKDKIEHIKKEQICGIEILDTIFMLALMNMILMGDGSSKLKRSNSLELEDFDFPTTVFLLNPPYSAEGKGFNFVEKALSKMEKGYACVLIQENAGAGTGGIYPQKILKTSSLIASIKMPLDLFSGKASVQTAIYLFEAGKPHDEDQLVTFIDFSEDGYTRMNRKKSSQKVNLRDTDDAKGRYAELIARVLDKKTTTNYYTEANGKLIRETISLDGNDWTYSQHVKLDNKPTIEDFKKTVKDYLSWKVSELIQRGESTLGKT